MSLSSRLSNYIQSKGLSINGFEKKIGVSTGLIAKAIKNNSVIGSNKLEKIFLTFHDINIHWLVTGYGEMITEYSTSSSLSPSMVNESKGNYDYEDFKIKTEMNLVIFRQSKEIFRLNDIVEKLEKDNKMLSGINNNA